MLGHGAGTGTRARHVRRRQKVGCPVSLLDLVIMAVIVLLIALTAGVYWHQSRQAERQHHAGGAGEDAGRATE